MSEEYKNLDNLEKKVYREEFEKRVKKDPLFAHAYRDEIQQIKELEADLDYQLTFLHHAKDQEERTEIVEKIKEIILELESLY